MGRPKRWVVSEPVDGIYDIQLSSWRYFDDFISQQLLDLRAYVYRGQASSAWRLTSTLDRMLEDYPVDQRDQLRSQHLRNFKLAARGRRGPNPPMVVDDNEWWALGQHYGLATPLLDWTTSPFVAAYFAFAQAENGSADRRSVYCLHRFGAERISSEIASDYEGPNRAPIVEFVQPLSDDNARLVSQGGLFSRAPDGVTLEDWISQQYKGSSKGSLLRITIPNRDRELCLRALNRMNINHASLFPDLYGSAKFCNFDLQIRNY